MANVLGMLLRPRPFLAPLLAVLAVAALLTAACSSSNETEPSPTAAATGPAAEEGSAAEALLKTVSLGAKDLPDGYTLVDERYITNTEAAGEGETSSEFTVEDLDRMGRILGYESVYSRESAIGGTLLLLLTTTIYRDQNGAIEAFGLLREQPSDPEVLRALQESLTGSNLDVQDATMSQLSFPEVGNLRLAYQLQTNVHIPDLNTNVNQYTTFVDIERGRGLGSIAAVAVGSPPTAQELEDLARKLDGRMKDALE